MSQTNNNKMGKWGATSYIIGNIVGSGIFITPSSIISNATSVGLVIVIWIISALISALGAYCYLELGTSIRKSGGDFAYLCYVKWRPIAFVFMSGACLITFPLSLAIQAETFSEYLLQGLGIQICGDEQKLEFFAKKLIGFSLSWLLLYLNFFSLKRTVSRFQIVASLAKLLSTAIIIFTGFYFLFIKGKTQNLQEPFKNSTLKIGALSNAFFAGLFSFDGWDILNFGIEDVENPKKAMTFAIIVGICSVALIYISINISYFVVLTIPQIENSIAVATTFSQKSLGSFQYCIPFLVCILLIGSLNSTLFSASRYLYAAAREHQLPAFISCINTKQNSPRAALLFHVILAIVLSFIGDINKLIGYVGFAMWMQRCFTISALLYIRFANIPVHSEAIRTPIFLPIIFLAISFSLVAATLIESFSISRVGLLMLTIGLIIYIIFIWEKCLKRYKWYRKITNSMNEILCILTQITFNGLIKMDDEDDEEMEELDYEDINKVE